MVVDDSSDAAVIGVNCCGISNGERVHGVCRMLLLGPIGAVVESDDCRKV